MRSETRFVMHPEDETEFARIVSSEAGNVFVDGPKWRGPGPPIARELSTSGIHLMIWNRTETPELVASHHRKDENEWWYCENEFLTIQFLRSGFQFGEPFLFEGRIAVWTTANDKTHFQKSSSPGIEHRFKMLRTYIKKNYTNGVIIWQNLSFPRSKTNPLKPDPGLWVGPQAMRWLAEEPRERWVQQFRNAAARGFLLDLVS
jgi:hypothetical protein